MGVDRVSRYVEWMGDQAKIRGRREAGAHASADVFVCNITGLQLKFYQTFCFFKRRRE